MAQRHEAGYVGRLKSLGGYEGAEWHGRIADIHGASITTDLTILSPANARRIALIIEAELENTDFFYIYLGDNAPAAAFLLYPGQSLQFDTLLPWTGAVYATASTGTQNIWVTEIGLE